ncbi:a44l protein-like protein [Trypanosoma grayi]|uniref:a44l protein-like protein n=1 Tax=Trypanosoma grayi TaxID=71804 RepID=UPI0004F408CB|nr:a44l protein-like protein [Trypanosoma grayi]KEG08935.1 a44l protein-like protein [Trypanosoma grayi]
MYTGPEPHGPSALMSSRSSSTFTYPVLLAEGPLRDQSSTRAPLPLVLFILALPLVIGVFKVLWLVLGASWRKRQMKRRGEVVRTITGQFHRGTSSYRWNEDGGNDHSGILLNSVLLYVVKRAGKSQEQQEEDLWWARDWRGKPSVLFLFDPLKSDSHLVLGPKRFEYVGYYHANVQQRAFHERKQLHRYTVVRLPTAGSWLSVGDGVELTYQRRRMDDKKVKRVNHMLHLRATGVGGAERLEAFVQQSLRHYMTVVPQSGGRERLFFQLQNNGMSLYFKKSPLPSSRSFDSMFFPQKEEVLALLDRFLAKRGRFALEGFPHKIGFLVHGPRGSGTTSFVAALASYTGRHVISVRLHMISSNRQLHDIFLKRELQCFGESLPFTFNFSDVIFLLDDVDSNDKMVRCRVSAAGEKQDEEAGEGDACKLTRLGIWKTKEADKVSLSGLLNVLDGVIDTPSRIVVMTTRDPEGIDPALLRPGRLGYKLHMHHMRLQELLGLLGLHFGTMNPHHVESCPETVRAGCEAPARSTAPRVLRDDEVERVRRCVAALTPDEFAMSPAVAESMCFRSPSLDAFLDELRRCHHSVS